MAFGFIGIKNQAYQDRIGDYLAVINILGTG